MRNNISMLLEFVLDAAKLGVKFPHFSDECLQLIRKAIDPNNIYISGCSYMIPNKEEIEIGQTKGKLLMIKSYKERVNVGVETARIVCEKYFNYNNLKFYTP